VSDVQNDIALQRERAKARARARARAAQAKGQQGVDKGADNSGLARTGGLAARAGIEGAVSGVFGLPALAADAVNSMRNWGPAVYNGALDLTGSEAQRMPLPTDPFLFSKGIVQAGEELANLAGTPQPETPGERLGTAVGSGAIGALTGVGLGSALSRVPGAVGAAGQALSAAPVLDTAAGAMGAGAAQAAQEGGLSPTQQMILGLVGAAAPAGLRDAGYGLAGAVRSAMRGGDAGAMRANIRQAGQEGIDLSAGQAAEGGMAKSMEGFLYNTPTGRGPIEAQRAAQTTQVQSAVSDITQLANGARPDPIRAGRAIQSEVTDVFTPQVRQTRDQLYGRVDRLIPDQTPIGIPSFRQTLEELTTVNPVLPTTTGRMNSPYLTQLRTGLEQDLTRFYGQPIQLGQINALPYEVMKDLRNRIGRQLESNQLISDLPRGELKRLYRTLMDDLRGSLQSQGNQQGLSALNRADQYNRAIHDRIDNILDPIAQRNTPEEAFNAAMANSAEGGTRLRVVMRSLQPEARRIVAATVLNRIGRAANSVQDETGEVFSVETFGTKWAGLSPVVKSEIAAALGPGMGERLDDIATAVSRIKSGTAAGRNTSGTAINTAFSSLLTITGGAAGAAVSGAPGAAVGGLAGAASSALASRALARLMVNPRFVGWLATTTRVPDRSLAPMLQALRPMLKDEDPETQQAVEEFLGAVQN
jgi:hypothetical protein